MNPESITNATIRGSADGSSKRCLGLNRSCTAVSKGFTNGAAGAVSSGSTASKSASCVVCYDPCDDAPVLECGHKHCGACLDSILRLSMGRYRYCCGVCRRPLLKRVTEVTDMLERGQLRSEPINFSDAGQVMEALRLLASVIDTAAQFITHVGVRPRLEVMVHSLIGLSYHKAGSHTNALGVLEPLFPLPVGCVGTHTATADVKRSVRDMVSSVAGGGTGDGVPSAWSKSIAEQLPGILVESDRWVFGYLCCVACARSCLYLIPTEGPDMYTSACLHMFNGTN